MASSLPETQNIICITISYKINIKSLDLFTTKLENQKLERMTFASMFALSRPSGKMKEKLELGES